MRFLFCLLLLTLLPSVAPARTLKDDISDFTETDSVSSETAPDLRQWHRELADALKRTDIDRAAASIAPKYRLTAAQMKQLALLWFAARDLPIGEDPAKPSPQTLIVRRRIAEFVQATGYNKLALEAAADLMARFNDCRTQDFDALLAAAPGRVDIAWTAVRTETCAAWYDRFARRFPGKSFGVLLYLSDYGVLGTEGSSALLDHLSSDAALAHVDPAQRTAAHAHLAFDRIERLWAVGATAQGLAVFAALPQPVRDLLLDGDLRTQDIVVDGLPVPFGPNGHGAKYWQGDVMVRDTSSRIAFRLDLAAAYLAMGRVADAKAALAPLDIGPGARTHLACALDFHGRDGNISHCPRETDHDGEFLLLDHALFHAPDDPYELAEMFFSGSDSNLPDSALFADLVCQVMAEPRYHALCEQQREGVVANLHYDRPARPSDKPFFNALAAAAPPDYAARRDAYAKLAAAAIARLGGHGFVFEERDRNRRAPPSPFEERPLPPALRGNVEARSWPNSLAPLPEGFLPVRFEVNGHRAVAISLSQDLDPTGEVSAGGYWVHISDDGGKTWRAPLYTGLADHWPYVALPASRLPMIDGEVLDVAVAVRELDLRSITYPPVMLATRRRADDLYLRIPLAALRQDSDGDGITDIVETHLLLDPHNPDSDGDGIPDGRDPMPNVKAVAGSLPVNDALALILEKITGAPTGALIEPVDRLRGALAPILGGLQASPNSMDRPIFVAGRRADFAAFSPARRMFVYEPADIARLQQRTPDFHALSLGQVVFNRAGTAGFVKYSTGWSGGTYRLRLAGKRWSIEQISGWIT
jgi:hypothetical protein